MDEISETTKEVVLEKKNELKAREQALQAEKRVHQDAIDLINAQIDALTARINAINTDIAEPVAAEIKE